MKQPVYYLQKDPKWANIPYTVDGDKIETIGYSGCGPTCAAMILAEWIDTKITPVQTCKMAIEMKDRTPNDGTEWEYFKHIADKYKISFKQTGNTDNAVEALKNGALVVCSMGPGYFTRSGHFILAWGVDGDNILVNDPISTIRSKATISKFKTECRQYFIFNKPKEMTVEEAIDIWTGIKIIGDPAGMKSDFQKGSLKPDRFKAFLIKSAKYIKGVK